MSYRTELICFSYACSAQSAELTERLKHSNKILLPPNVLYELNQEDEELEETLFFKVINKENEFGQVCGMQEFSAPPGVCHIPYHIMSSMGVQEGDTIEIELASPPKGTYMKLQPHATEFINLSDPKATLEHILSRDYPVVTAGETIAVYYKELDTTYHINILETKPEPTISIINANINVDFERPVDYIEPAEKKEPEQPQLPASQPKVSAVRQVMNSVRSKMGVFVPFSGAGHRLGSE